MPEVFRKLGMKIGDIKQAEDLIFQNRELIIEKWHEVHGS